MKRYGCIGKKLTHSFSKEIHARLADYSYQLMELAEDQVGPFLQAREFSAINVTIPYKQTVIPYLDEVSEVARRIGAVNTIVNKNGRLWGYNTDYYGMKALAERLGVAFSGKKVLILGTGGTAKTAYALSCHLGAAVVQRVSRSKGEGVVTYEEAVRLHGDAQILINTTPVGMYPAVEGRPLDVGDFPCLEAVLDAVYNPLCTDLVLDARQRGIPAEGGLYMLVMQAVAAVEKFLGTEVEREKALEAYAFVRSGKENIVLTGMPGSGKSTVGRLLQGQGLAFFDSDEEIEKRCGCSIRRLIESKGEEYFRSLETEVIRQLSAEGGRILSTGGGAILREENLRCLKRNGRIFFLDAPLSRLRPTDDRPLSDTEDKLKRLYQTRLPLYRACADVTVPAMERAEDEAAYILQKRREDMV